MDDAARVHVVHRVGQLRQQVEHPLLAQLHAAHACRGQLVFERSTGRELHHDAELAVLEKRVVVSDDVRVLQPRQEPYLVDRCLLLGGTHVGVAHLLHRELRAIGLARDEKRPALRALTQHAAHLILLHVWGCRTAPSCGCSCGCKLRFELRPYAAARHRGEAEAQRRGCKAHERRFNRPRPTH